MQGSLHTFVLIPIQGQGACFIKHGEASSRFDYVPQAARNCHWTTCEKCDGKCVICDSYVRPCTLVRVCDECNYGSFQGRCVICGGVGISDAYYCKECTQQARER
ncbi:PHD finger-like domain-containing protein 5B [Morella rubra]|uniref:PHD finger-like domain-containing protein 5B n=1 Tax=Morella rubra TaxID=262757 RepID=A0A6A1WLL4_9ROSI|nr:PHD finger-like domain-containing protein 5B [Morella rubra]